MTHSPYRHASRAQIDIAGEPSTTISLWAIWLMTVVLFLAAIAVERIHRALVLAVAAGVAVGVAALLYRAARRVRWRLTLDDSDLHIERRTMTTTKTVVVGVRAGVTLDLGVADGIARVDQCIILTAGPTRVTMTAGARPADTLHQLAQFLREHDVTVVEHPDRPVGWTAGGAFPG
jgi:hypothetical protein